MCPPFTRGFGEQDSICCANFQNEKNYEPITRCTLYFLISDGNDIHALSGKFH